MNYRVVFLCSQENLIAIFAFIASIGFSVGFTIAISILIGKTGANQCLDEETWQMAVGIIPYCILLFSSALTIKQWLNRHNSNFGLHCLAQILRGCLLIATIEIIPTYPMLYSLYDDQAMACSILKMPELIYGVRTFHEWLSFCCATSIAIVLIRGIVIFFENGCHRNRHVLPIQGAPISTTSLILHTRLYNYGTVEPMHLKNVDSDANLVGDDENSSSSSSNDGEQCMICLCKFCQGVAVRELKCGHSFHDTCLSTLLSRHSSKCPLCCQSIQSAKNLHSI